MGPLEEDEKISIDFPDNIAGFTTTDLFGNEVTSAVFAEKDVTLVNIWGTFCDPCIEELPDLQELSESMPENAQLIGIVGDVKSARNDEYVEALSLVGKNGITYTNLLADRSMKFMDKVMFVPTTVLVDSEGNVIGQDIPLHLSRFFPRFKMTDRGPTDPRTIFRLVDIAKEKLNYVYPGNI